MPAKRIRQREDQAVEKKEFLPFILGKDLDDEIKDEEGKITLFEKGLENELSANDTLEDAIHKIVKMALASEFGPSFVKSDGADGMVETIVSGILSDNELRKQALVLVDRFAK